MSRWLLKSEPDVYGFDDLVREGRTVWSGVRSNPAALNLKRMQAGDEAFFYHSNIGKTVVACCAIVRAAYPDPTDETGRWVAVDVVPGERLARPVTLAQIKADPALAGFALVRQSRLSVVPVDEAEWARILAMAA